MRGCVLAGIWGAGKTSIYRRSIIQLLSNGCESLIAMPQAATITTHTYVPGGPHEHAAGIQSWLESLTTFLEDFNRRFQASSLPSHRFANLWTPTSLFEGLGFDVPVYGIPLPRSILLDIECRLAALGLHLVVLRVPHDRILTQCVESTQFHRGPKWIKYLAQFGHDNPARADYIEQMQDLLLQWAHASPMPLHVLDIETDNWDAYARKIVELIMPLPTATHGMHEPKLPSP